MKSLKRILIYICGIFLLALGGVLAIKSNLGASPVSSLPLSISKVTTLSLGTAAAILFTIYVGIQILILRKEFKIVQLMQIIFAILFGQITNFFNVMININVESVYVRIVVCTISFFVTATGVFLTITTDLVPVAPDGLVQVIGQKSKKEFGLMKIYFDCVVVAISVITLLIGGKGLEGLGIGTILSALLVGRIVFFINKNLKSTLENVIFS